MIDRMPDEDGNHDPELTHILAGLLSTIDVQPSENHPEAMLPWAVAVLRAITGNTE